MRVVVTSFQQNKSKSKHTPFWVILVFSFFLILCDLKTNLLVPVRNALSWVLFPVVYGIDAPFLGLKTLSSLYTDKKQLLEEVSQLKKERLLLQAELQKTQFLRHENQNLLNLLTLSKKIDQSTLGARVLHFSLNAARHLVLIDRGKSDQVSVGLPVLDAYGLMGQVIEVQPQYSVVMLLSDPLSAVPVKNNRTNERAIVVGNGQKKPLSFIHLPKTSLVAVGDVLLTSGLGGRYPEGYPVGRVLSVQHRSSDEFMVVDVEPFAFLRQSETVLLLTGQVKSFIFSSYLKNLMGDLD